MEPSAVQHGLETPCPLQPAQGYLRLSGWVLIPGAAAPTLTRLRVGDTFFAPAQIIDRPDVAASFPGDPHALRSGFQFLCYLPFGLHLGALEASADGITWKAVRTLAIPVSSHPLLGTFETPVAGTFIDQPLRVAGWCFHPEFTLAAVSLRFGNIEVPCELGLRRDDVAARFPQHPAAALAGFITAANLPRGAGRLRLRADTTCGRVFFLDAHLDGNITAGDDAPQAPLSSLREPPALPPLQPADRATGAPRPVTGTGPHNILFALHGDFTCNSALHVAALANELIALGYDCVVAGPAHKETVGTLPRARFMAVEFSEVDDLAGYFLDGLGPTVVHAWTPRESVRTFVAAVQARYHAAVVVHLEDNERELLEKHTGLTEAELLALPESELSALVPAELSHPRRSREFLAAANGITTIVDRLQEFAPPGVPVMTFWPAADAHVFKPRPSHPALRAALGIQPDDTVLFYHGNVHAANAAEVGHLYDAVAQLNQAGRRTFLVRTGRDAGDLLREAAARIGSFLLNLDHIARATLLPEVMRLADYFVQPGVPGAFNDYRFPSKLPEFFAIGRPVILPSTNLGRVVLHGQHAYVLPRADAGSIAAAVLELHGEPALVERLGAGALAFAAEHFSWSRSTRRVLDFYLAHSPLVVSAS